MKPFPSLLQRGLRLLAFQLGLLLCPTLPAAVGFTVTPSSVSNTYSGINTLQVTGLTSGESVVVQKFLDVNTNGVIDAADLLWQQFQLTDGQASVIGGVTNINVPGDTDVIPGQITARVLFRNTDPVLNIIGKYSYKLSSPTGLFAPITNSFMITNAGYAQSLTGNVVSHGTNVPHAVVILFLPEPGSDGPGSTVGGTVANSTGSYSIQIPVGTYGAVAFKSNYLGNLRPLPVTVSSGAMVTTNVTLTNATRTLSGRLVDAANPSSGLPGLFVHADSGGLVSVVTSDTNGNFTFPVAPGYWNVGAEGVEALGYINVDSDTRPPIDTSTGSVSGLVIFYPKADALFYGTVKDDQDQPLAGFAVESENDDYSAWHVSFTDDNGKYVAGALGGVTWEVEVDDDQPGLANFLFPQNFTTNINAGQAMLLNFTAVRATNRITGHVQDNQGHPIPDVEIYAYADIGAHFYSTRAYTDAGGNYSMYVANGTWTVGASYGDPEDMLTGHYLPPPSQTVGVTNSDRTVNFTAMIAPHRITGSVKGAANNPFSDVFVSAYGMMNGTNLSVWGWTDASGNYTLPVVNGDWYVMLCCGCYDWPADYCCPNSQNVTVANSDRVVDFALVQTGQIVITTSSPLPRGSLLDFYWFQFEAASCVQNLHWTATNPPPGLELDSWGALYGVPTAAGSNYFFIEVDDGAGHGAIKAFSLVIHSGLPDVDTYHVTKLRNHRQTNSASVVLDGERGPYGAMLGILQTDTGLVASAICTLSNSDVKVFPAGNSDLELIVYEAFASESALNSAYPSGAYGFDISGVNDGDQFAALNLPATAFPNTPRISNYAAAQAINPGEDFELEWDAFSGGTLFEDFIRLIIFDPNTTPLPKLVYPEALWDEWLDTEATSTLLPAGLLQDNAHYLGLLQFIRETDFNDSDYPGAYGLAGVVSQTFFNLSTLSLAPKLDSPARLSSSEFRFDLTGLAEQNYTILKSTNLNSTNWSVLLVTNAPAVVVDSSATNSRAFYRAVFGP